MGTLSSAAFVNINPADRTLSVSMHPDDYSRLVTPIANDALFFIHTLKLIIYFSIKYMK
jgi:hypothetical protein